nr:cell surface protein [uncultured bacterium]
MMYNPMKETRTARALVMAALALLASPTKAQEPGDILWSTTLEQTVSATHSRPALGPDGTLYVMVKDLFAIAPDGALRWRAPLQSLSVSTVGVSADGQVHISADFGPQKVVIAYNPDGVEQWRTTVDATTSAFYGPSVGPGGDLFAVVGSQGGALGAFALASTGALRWNASGFTDEGTNVKSRDVPLGSDRFFVSERGVPCSPTGWGTAALSFAGDLLWCVPGLVQLRPDVGPGDVVYGIGFNVLTKFSSDGDVLWRFPFPPPVEPLEAPTVGPDGTIYVPEGNELWAFEPDGSVRYHIESGLGSAFGRVSVSPDGQVLLYPVGGSTRELIALDTASGSVLWRTALPYPPDGPPTFSADGQVAYVARWGGPQAPSELMAFYVGDPMTTSRPTADLPSGHVLSVVYPNPFNPQARFTLEVAQSQSVTIAVFDALGRRVALLQDGPLPSGAAHTFTLDGAGLPSGVYVVRALGETFESARTVTLLR